MKNKNFRWDNDEVRFVLDQHDLLDFYSAHWNNSPQIDTSPHSVTLSWFRANRSLLFLLNAVCLAEMQQIPILLYLVWPEWGSNPWSTVLEANTPQMRFFKYAKFQNLGPNFFLRDIFKNKKANFLNVSLWWTLLKNCIEIGCKINLNFLGKFALFGIFRSSFSGDCKRLRKSVDIRSKALNTFHSTLNIKIDLFIWL